MKNLSKNRKNILSNIDLTKTYKANEAIKILKDNSFVKFDETLDVAIKLNINPSKSDQNIRGVVSLPIKQKKQKIAELMLLEMKILLKKFLMER